MTYEETTTAGRSARSHRWFALALLIATTLSLAGGLGLRSAAASSGTFGTFAPIGYGALAFGPDGALYSTDCANGRVYRIDRTGQTTVVAGSGPGGFTMWVKDRGWVATYSGDGGPAIEATLNCPTGIAFDAAGNMFIADHGNNVIRRVDRRGIITTVAGQGPSETFAKGPWVPGIGKQAGDGGPASQAIFDVPASITFDTAGNMYIADRDHDAVRKIDTNGIVTTVAGTGVRGYSGDGGPAASAKLNRPIDVTVDQAGNLYITDEDNMRIRKVDAKGIISTVAGNGSSGCAGDGAAATLASFKDPNDIAFGPDGSLFVGDHECFRVRRIGGNGIIHPAVGTGVRDARASTVLPSRRTWRERRGSCSDPRGDLYMSDCGPILRIDPQGQSHVFATAPDV